MKRLEYSAKLREAKAKGITKWNSDAEIDFGCALCVLTNILGRSCFDRPTCCPINDFSRTDWINHKKDCCKEYTHWQKAETERTKKKWALRLVERLKTIDVEAWADKMVEYGYIDKDAEE